jgi:recombination protein RecT
MSNQQTWPELVNEVQPQFNQIAEVHKLVLWKAESQFAIQAIQKNKYLSECLPFTVQNAIINVASVGLTLNPADGYAYLVPEYNKDLQAKECQLRISFKGLVKVATDSGGISWVKAEIVKQNDTFEYLGVSQEPKHVMEPFSDRGETVGVYCVAKTNDGDFLVDTMPKAEIDQIRKCAKFDTVWNTWYDEMAKKAIIKRASKQWPRTDKSGVLNAAVSVMNETEGSDPNYLIFTPEQQEAFDKAVENKAPLSLLALTDKMDGEIYGALVKANKERFRESKGMTAQNELIVNLNSEGNQLFREQREEILAQLEDNNPQAVDELFGEFEAYGLKRKLWDSFDEDEQRQLTELSEAA